MDGVTRSLSRAGEAELLAIAGEIAEFARHAGAVSLVDPWATWAWTLSVDNYILGHGYGDTRTLLAALEGALPAIAKTTLQGSYVRVDLRPAGRLAGAPPE